MRIFLSLALLASSFSYANQPSVLLKYNQTYQGFFHTPYLAEVLQVANTADIYWPSARLYQTDANAMAKVEQNRAAVLQLLQQLRQHYKDIGDDKVVSAFDLLTKDISKWQLAMPVNVNANLDLARAKPAANPKLTAGQYLLVVKKRPETIFINGLSRNQNLSIKAMATAADYHADIQLLDGADKNYLYVLQLGKQPVRVGTAIWNREQFFVGPWMQLMVGVDESALPDEFTGLNQKLAELVMMRVYL